jgi:hypothetical protein
MDRSVLIAVVLGALAPGLGGCAARVEARANVPPPPRAEIVVAARPAPPVEQPAPPVAVVERPAPPVAEVVVEAPPPAPPIVVEPAPPRPGPEFILIEGYHRWNGHAYVWERAHWERPARPGLRWIPARWEPRARGHVWVEGHWG